MTTYMSGIVGESDNVYLGGYPGPLKEMAGIWVEEIDALAPEQYNIVTFKDGSQSKCKIVCDLMIWKVRRHWVNMPKISMQACRQ